MIYTKIRVYINMYICCYNRMVQACKHCAFTWELMKDLYKSQERFVYLWERKIKGWGRDPLPKLKVAAKNSSIKLQTTAWKLHDIQNIPHGTLINPHCQPVSTYNLILIGSPSLSLLLRKMRTISAISPPSPSSIEEIYGLVNKMEST